MKSILLALYLIVFPTKSIKSEPVSYQYRNDIGIRLLACQWQYNCKGGMCVVKWNCPWPVND